MIFKKNHFQTRFDFGDSEPAPQRKTKAASSGGRHDFHTAPPPTDYVLPQPVSLRGAKRLSIDIETHDPFLKEKGPGCRRGDGKLVGIAVRTDDGRGDYYPVGHDTGPNLPKEEVLHWLKQETRDFTGEIIGANPLYDYDWLNHEGVPCPRGAKFRDVQWGAALLDEHAESYKLNALLQTYLGLAKQTDEVEKLYGKDFISNFHLVHPGHARTYALGDVEPLFDLEDAIVSAMRRDGEDVGDGDGLVRLYDMECALFPMLAYMRQQGTRVDLARAEQANIEFDTLINEQIAKIKHITGRTISPSAPTSEVADLLSDHFAIPKTMKGGNSVTSKWLEGLGEDPLAEAILALRKYGKFKGTFVQSYFLEHQVNGRIHTQFHPLRGDEFGTVSGRFSSSVPNLQNIPVRDKAIGPLARGMFIPRDGRLWWSRDYSQIEYRLLVHFAEKAGCTGADIAADMYRNDPKTDFHETAAKITGLPRKIAKAINFGVVYGLGADSMAQTLNCSLAEAIDRLDQFHGVMPFGKEVYNEAQNLAKRKGRICTLMRRRRRFTMWQHKDTAYGKKRFIEAYPRDKAIELWGEKDIRIAYTNTALNALLQGSAADIMKKAMKDAWEAGIFDGTGVDCTLTVHDELDGDHDETPRAREALAELDHLMSTAVKLRIPLMADGTSGKNWHDSKN